MFALPKSLKDVVTLFKGEGDGVLKKTDGAWELAVANGEPVLGNPDSDGHVLASTAAGVRSWKAPLELKQTEPTSVASGSSMTVTGTAVISVSEYVAGGLATPTMTSNTEPSGVVSSSNSSVDAWKALNADTTGAAMHWIGASPLPQWWQYKFASAKRITTYAMNNQWCNGNFIKAWNFQGSNDGTNWTTLDSRDVGTTTSYWDSTRSYTITSPNTYLYYRVYITAVMVSGQYAAINEIYMYASGTYNVLLPVTDYTLTRSYANGSQTISVKRVKAGTANMVADYI